MRSVIIFGTIAALLAVSPCRGDTKIDAIRSANAASQNAFATLQARIELTIQHNPASLPSGVPAKPDEHFTIEYTRSGDKERIRESPGPFGIREIVRDAASQTGSVFVPKRGGKTIDSAVLSSNSAIQMLVEPWELTLFQFPECKSPLYQLLATPGIRMSEVTTARDSSLVHFEIRDSKDNRYEIWVEPRENYLVKKLICRSTRSKKSEIRIEQDVASVKEVEKGIFFPDRTSRTVVIDGKWATKADCTIIEIRFNPPLPPDYFSPTFPAGTMVADDVRGGSYRVGSNGTPGTFWPRDASQFKSNQSERPPQSATPLNADNAGWPWYRYLLVACVLVLVVAVPLVIWNLIPMWQLKFRTYQAIRK